MSTEEIKDQEEVEITSETKTENTSAEESTQENIENEEVSEEEKEQQDFKDKYLRLYSEFENFRKRTNKEKLDIITTASESVIKDIIPTLDDFDRAITHNETSDDIESVKEGFKLIHNKLYKTLEKQGLSPLNAKGKDFDTELHEAITQFPAPSDDMKGKVIDEVEKGYKLGEKVVRFSKVVIGS